MNSTDLKVFRLRDKVFGRLMKMPNVEVGKQFFLVWRCLFYFYLYVIFRTEKLAGKFIDNTLELNSRL